MSASSNQGNQRPYVCQGHIRILFNDISLNKLENI